MTLSVDSNRPFVSIVIPVYNGANYVAHAIDSALAQTWDSKEVIVIDDGSDDGGATAHACAAYGDRIRYFYKVNGGVATALNFGIQVMRGDFFSWLSHDDAYTPDRLAIMLEAHARAVSHAQADPRPVIVFSDHETADVQGTRIRVQRRRIDPGESTARTVVESTPHGCGLLIPRQCFVDAGLFHPGLPTTQDAELWFRMTKTARFEHVPHATVISRRHPEQASHTTWHHVDRITLRQSLCDRIDNGEAPDVAPNLMAFYHSAVSARGVWAMPGVRRDVLQRRARACRRQNITLAHTPNATAGGREAARKLRRAGYRVQTHRVAETGLTDAAEIASRTSSDLLWFWNRPVKAAPQTLKAMLNLIATSTGSIGCLYVSKTAALHQRLVSLHGALLPVHLLHPMQPSQGWAELAHALSRKGLLAIHHPRSIPARNKASPPTGTDSLEKCVAMRLLPAPRAGRWGRLRRLPLRGIGYSQKVAHRVGTTLKGTLRLGISPRGQRTWPGIAAHLSRSPRIFGFMCRTVMQVSDNPALGHQRLLRMTGLTGLFDAAWYCYRHPAAAEHNDDPLLHFLTTGWQAGCDPSPGFSIRGYLRHHPDVDASKINPLQHYAVRGRFEDRTTVRSSADLTTADDHDSSTAPTIVLLAAHNSMLAASLAQGLAAQLKKRCKVHAFQQEDSGWVRAGDEHNTTVGPDDIHDFLEATALLVTIGAVETDHRVEQFLRYGAPLTALHTDTRINAEVCAHAARHYSFSETVKRMVEQQLSSVRVQNVPFPDAGGELRARPWRRQHYRDECCRVAMFGNLREGPELTLVRRMLYLVKRFRLPMSFVLFGKLEGTLSNDQSTRFHVESTDHQDVKCIANAVCAFNPHVAWIPNRNPEQQLTAVEHACMMELPLAAIANTDTRRHLAGRPLTWLSSETTGAIRWIILLYRIFSTPPDPAQWQPRHPLEGFDSTSKTLSHNILETARAARRRKGAKQCPAD